MTRRTRLPLTAQHFGHLARRFQPVAPARIWHCEGPGGAGRSKRSTGAAESLDAPTRDDAPAAPAAVQNLMATTVLGDLRRRQTEPVGRPSGSE